MVKFNFKEFINGLDIRKYSLIAFGVFAVFAFFVSKSLIATVISVITLLVYVSLINVYGGRLTTPKILLAAIGIPFAIGFILPLFPAGLIESTTFVFVLPISLMVLGLTVVGLKLLFNEMELIDIAKVTIIFSIVNIGLTFLTIALEVITEPVAFSII